MKTINSRTLLGLALLGTMAVAPLATPTAQAAPADRAPAYGRRAKNNSDKKDKRYNDRRDQRENYDRENYDRDRYDSDSDYRTRYDGDRNNNRTNATYTGTVSNVRAGNSFDLRANGRTYNVYTSSLPRALNNGDEVRVYGRPYGDNDIRNANVVVTSNTSDDRYTNGRYDPSDKRGDYRNDARNEDYRNDTTSDDYRTYSGEVTGIRNDREFDVRIGNTTYNVYASAGTRGLNKGDTVRVYGQRYGDNDIRNANATITRNR